MGLPGHGWPGRALLELHHDPREPARVDVRLGAVLELGAGPAVAEVGEAVAEHLDLGAEPGIVEILAVDERHDAGRVPGVAAQAEVAVSRKPGHLTAERERTEVLPARVHRVDLAAQAARKSRVPYVAVARGEQAHVGKPVTVVPVVQASEGPVGGPDGVAELALDGVVRQIDVDGARHRGKARSREHCERDPTHDAPPNQDSPSPEKTAHYPIRPARCEAVPRDLYQKSQR